MTSLAAPVSAATLTVAADGTGDYASLSSALNAASSGDTIYIQRGAYSESSSITISKTNITIKGESADKVTLDMPGHYLDIQGSGCHIENLKFLSSFGVIKISSSNCIVKNNILEKPIADIDIYSSYNTISNNIILNPSSDGICIESGANFNNISDNVILGAVVPSGYGALIRGASNFFENNTIQNGSGNGLFIYKGTNNTITKNSFINNTNAGIKLSKAGIDNNIYLNTFSGNGGTVTKSGTTSAISWVSPSAVDYTYNGTKQSSILGNYWGSSYSSTDDDSNGIGDTYYTVPDDLGNDTAPLMGIWQDGNVVSQDSVKPIAGFTASSFDGQAPFAVTFTGWSSGPGTVTSYLWDFGDGNTSTDQNPSHTYTTGGNYTVKLTLTGPGGSNSLEKTGFINVTGADADLMVSSISSLYPGVQNTVTATIKNQGSMDAGSFKVQFTLNGNTTNFDVPELAAGNTTTLNVTDPVSRKYGDNVPINITLDTENSVAETDETNNKYNTTATVTTNGDYYTGGRYYTGNDLETGIYKEGNIAVKYSQGDSGYQTGGGWYSTTVKWTGNDLPIPANATIKEARLYQSYTWCYNGNPDFTLKFNGNTVNQAAFYADPVKNEGGTVSGFNGQVIYDVTPYLNSSSNTAIITTSKPSGGLYGTVLVVIYEDASEPYRMIWLDEGCDTLYGSSDDSHIAYAMFNNSTTENMVSAKITTILPSGGDSYLGAIICNGKSSPIIGSGGGDPGYKWYNVTGTLQNGINEIGVRNDGGYLNLASAILEVTKNTASEANFSANVTSGDAPLVVKFTDTSTGTPTNWTWDFGDGGSSTEQNPTHIYTTEGNYTVKLTVKNSLGSDSEEKTGYITVGSAVLAPEANFSSNATSGKAPLTVQFKDNSTNTPTSWEWDFGDGKTSIEQNPSHTYETVGTYTVNLTAMNYGGSNDTTKTDYITVTSDTSAPVASFTTDSNSGKVPFTVKFTDTSTGKVSSWNWNFGDGSTSTDQDPTHTYVTEGSYNVTLTATGLGGSNTATSAEPITVSAPLTSPSYNGGIPLTTAQNGTVSGGLWYDSYPGFSTSAQKTFTLPDYTKIKWARLYVDVYDGHMENNYRGNVNIGIDANGDSTYEIQKNETFDTTYSFPGEGGTGPVWLNDHMNRVTSDYLMWYDLTDLISGKTVNVQATTTKVDSSFDGRVKAMTLVVAYDDGDSDQVYYWVNQGHDTVNPLDETYTGSTSFGTSSLESGWSSTNLTAIYLASKDGVYTFNGTTLDSGVASGSYYGANTWDISSFLNAGKDSALAYNKQGSNYYKIPLALMSVRYTSVSPELPTAEFKADVTSGTAPLTVNFTDQSTGSPTSWLWDFGDGTNSTEQNVSHTYTSAGNYTVNLTVSNAGGDDSEVKTEYIVVSEPLPGAPVANFTANRTSGTAPLNVQFTDASTGNISSYAWDFDNDGTVDSTEQNPIYTYDAAGNYTVNLTVANEGGNDSEVKTDYIVVSEPLPGAPVADFAATPTSGNAPLTVNFTDISTGSPTNWQWDFNNDGTVDSTEQNPVYTYPAAGNYTVNLTVTGPGGSDSEVKTGYINVASPSPSKLVAAFSASPNSGKAPLKVAFTDTSTGSPTSWKWDFGDGTTSTKQNPVHKYSKAGIYTVNLTVKNAKGSNTVTKTDYIKVITKPVANFTSSVTSGKAPLQVTFTDTSTGSPISWKWDFGDGSKSFLQNPTHKYSKVGSYTVNLTVKNAKGSNMVTKTEYIKVVTKSVADFSATPTSGKAPLTVEFTDNSTGIPTAWKWSFGDGTTSREKNPEHQYLQGGNYKVTLTVVNVAGSSTVTKKNYIKVTTNTRPGIYSENK